MKKLEDRLDERLELGDCKLISMLRSYVWRVKSNVLEGVPL